MVCELKVGTLHKEIIYQHLNSLHVELGGINNRGSQMIDIMKSN